MQTRKRTEFGVYVVSLIKKKKMSHCDFYAKLGVSKPFFYDMLAGFVSPTIEMQYKMVEILQPRQEEGERFFDLCAKQRGDIPADIFTFIKKNPKSFSEIRKMIYD